MSKTRNWTKFEIEHLLCVSRESGKKLLFLWHGVNEDEVRAWSEDVACRLGTDTSEYSIGRLAQQVA